MKHEKPLHLNAIRMIATALAISCALAVATYAAAGDAGASVGRMVALGDSSASGPSLGPKYPGSPPECERTTGGYPALVAQRVVYGEFVNETCSGATTSSLFAGYTFPGSGVRARAQLDALNGTERAVLISVGDNDAGFGEVTNNCLYHGGSNANVCTQTYVSGGVNSLIARGQSIATNVGKSIDAIKNKSKKAKVFLVGYPDIAPTNVSGCAGLMWLTQTDAPVFEQWEVAVNDTLRETARSHGAYFVDAYSQSGAHTGCASPAEQRWTNPVVGGTSGIGLHPSAAGADAVANMVTDAMRGAGLYLGSEARIQELAFAKLRPAPSGSVFSRNAPARGGAAVTVELDAVATVGLKLESVKSGRMVNGKCRAVSRSNRSAKHCSRFASRGGWWNAYLPKGATKIYVTGRAAGRKLAKGRYRIRLRSESLHVATPTTASFTAVK